MSTLAETARLDAIAQAELVAKGEVSRAELFDAWRERHDALNPLLRAVVTEADAPPRAAEGPLSGVPFLVKDSMPWPGMRWSMGSRALARERPLAAPLFGRRLMQAGLVCVGKTACSELGLLPSTETLFEGVTHNPWDLSRSAGGSSGGSAVAVAAGLVPIAHASDGGGSIRVPASHCGVFGFKPSRGRTLQASDGGSDFERMTSDHCITRSVRDSALFLSIVEDESYGDRIGYVREPLTRSLRVATWSHCIDGSAPAPEALAALATASALLTDLGHRVEPLEPMAFDTAGLGRAFFVVAGAAVSAFVDRLDHRRESPVQREELEPFTWSLLDLFLTEGPGTLERARAAFASAVQLYHSKTRDFDVVLSPSAAAGPWPLGHLSPLVEREELLGRIARLNTFAPLANIVGSPAMSIPLGLHNGLPVGAHFAAATGADALLLRLAYQLEEARPWRDRWPMVSIPMLAQQDPS